RIAQRRDPYALVRAGSGDWNLVRPPFHIERCKSKSRRFKFLDKIVDSIARWSSRKEFLHLYFSTSAKKRSALSCTYERRASIFDSIFDGVRAVCRAIVVSRRKRRGFQTVPDKFLTNAEAREIGARRRISDEILHGSWLPNLFI